MVEEKSESITGLVIGAAVFFTLFFLGAVLPRNPDFDLFFGLEAYRALGAGVLILAVGLFLTLLLVPGLAAGSARGLGWGVATIPGRLRTPLLLAASAAVFWLLPTYKLSGDAVTVILRTSLGNVYASNPLTSFLTIGVSRALAWPAAQAIRLVSCAFGVLYVFCAVRIARECFSAGPARAAFGVVLVSGGTCALFFGSIEVYAPLAAAIGLYLYLGVRVARRGGSILWPALALGTAFGLHGSAGLLLPSLAYVANGCRIRPMRFKRMVLAGAAFLVPVVLVFGAVYFIAWGGAAPDAAPERFGSFFGGNGQGALLPLRLTATNVLYQYAFLDAEHLIGVLNLILLAAPAGLLLLVLGRRPLREDAAFRFAGIAAVFLVAFPVFWNVNYPLRHDWDLFSPMGIPLGLLGGLAFLGRGGGARRAVGAAALSLLCFVPFVLSNRGDTYDRRLCSMDLFKAMRTVGALLPKEAVLRREIAKRAGEGYLARVRLNDPHDAETETDRALLLARNGSFTLAETLFRRVLGNEPGNARAAEGLGSVLLARGKKEEARHHLLNALRAESWRLSVRMNLARIALADGDEDEAIRQLEHGLRRGGLHHMAGQALVELAELRARKGEAETAEALRVLAAERGITRPGARGGGPTRPR